MGRKNTDDDVAKRRAAIEEYMVRGDWTLRRQAQVAEAFGVSVSQVRTDAAWIRRQWADQQVEQSKDELRADWRQRVHKAMRQASDVGHTHTVAKLLATEARVLGLEEPQQLQIQAQVHTIDDAGYLARQLIEALPDACELLGIETPKLPIIEGD